MRHLIRSPQNYQRTPIRAEMPSTRDEGDGVVSLRLYDAIDSYGDFWGVSAREFTQVLDTLPAGTREIRLLINCPGGEVWDGLAILNALRAHPARVVAIVEGIAASAATFIATGVDELVMMRNSELFIHNAIGGAYGDADFLRETAADLEHLDRNLASIYAAKTGDTVEYWLEEMPHDRWYSAEEAVEARLADRIDTDTDGQENAATARARFDLTVLARDQRDTPTASAVPQTPSSTEPGGTNQKERADMAYDDLMAGLRERLGVTDADASDETLLAALDESLAEQATPPAPVTAPEGTVLIDADALAELRTNAALGAQARAEQTSNRRDGIIREALDDGRITPANQKIWRDQLDANEEGTIAVLNTLARNTIPVNEIGHSDQLTSADDALWAGAGWTDQKGA